MRGATEGRNEETASKYAEGIRVKQNPSSRQQQHTGLVERNMAT